MTDRTRIDAPAHGPNRSTSQMMLASITDEVRILIVAGVVYGAVVAGLGSRLAMFLLRVTSPGSVVGLQSDDDFTIGRFTVGGTYNLLVIGALAGIIGAGVYRLVAPWLIGPAWFQRMTTGVAAGAVVGAMLVHADGIDFRVLKPTWLAVGVFVALPAVFGTFIGPVVDRVARPASWTRRGRRVWMLPVVSVLAFPPTVILVSFASVFVTVLLVLRETEGVRRLRVSISYGLAVRAVWLGVAVLGLLSLIQDIVDISRVV